MHGATRKAEFVVPQIAIINMKVIIALALFVAVALAAPQHGADKDARIVRFESDIGVDGYKYGYETSNGISVQEAGQLQNVGSERESLVVRGSYSFVGQNGVHYTVTYVADENGFQPEGAHIPKL